MEPENKDKSMVSDGVPEVVRRLVESNKGKIDWASGPLPDGSGAVTASFPLPKTHWLYEDKWDVPPMGLRCGENQPLRAELEKIIRAAGMYAVRVATTNGEDDDWDPDALCQNLVVGLLGYHTPDGLSYDKHITLVPEPVPMEVTSILRGDVLEDDS